MPNPTNPADLEQDEIITLFALSNFRRPLDEIAEELHIAPITLKRRCQSIYGKFESIGEDLGKSDKRTLACLSFIRLYPIHIMSFLNQPQTPYKRDALKATTKARHFD